MSGRIFISFVSVTRHPAVPWPTGCVWLAAKGVSQRDSSSFKNGCGCLHYGCHSSSGPFQHADSFGFLSCRCGFRSEPVCQMQVSGCCQWRELNSTQDRVLIKSLTCPINMRPTVYILVCSDLICWAFFDHFRFFSFCVGIVGHRRFRGKSRQNASKPEH